MRSSTSTEGATIIRHGDSVAQTISSVPAAPHAPQEGERVRGRNVTQGFGEVMVLGLLFCFSRNLK